MRCFPVRDRTPVRNCQHKRPHERQGLVISPRPSNDKLTNKWQNPPKTNAFTFLQSVWLFGAFCLFIYFFRSLYILHHSLFSDYFFPSPQSRGERQMKRRNEFRWQPLFGVCLSVFVCWLRIFIWWPTHRLLSKYWFTTFFFFFLLLLLLFPFSILSLSIFFLLVRVVLCAFLFYFWLAISFPPEDGIAADVDGRPFVADLTLDVAKELPTFSIWPSPVRPIHKRRPLANRRRPLLPCHSNP